MNNKTELLLLVEDPTMMSTLGMMMYRGGFEVHTAVTFAEAQDLLAQIDIDLCLIDWNLNQPTFFPNLNELRIFFPHLPLLVLSAEPSATQRRKAWRYGVSGYLVKPIDPRLIFLNIFAILTPPPPYPSSKSSTFVNTSQ